MEIWAWLHNSYEGRVESRIMAGLNSRLLLGGEDGNLKAVGKEGVCAQYLEDALKGEAETHKR